MSSNSVFSNIGINFFKRLLMVRGWLLIHLPGCMNLKSI